MPRRVDGADAAGGRDARHAAADAGVAAGGTRIRCRRRRSSARRGLRLGWAAPKTVGDGGDGGAGALSVIVRRGSGSRTTRDRRALAVTTGRRRGGAGRTARTYTGATARFFRHSMQLRSSAIGRVAHLRAGPSQRRLQLTRLLPSAAAQGLAAERSTQRRHLPRRILSRLCATDRMLEDGRAHVLVAGMGRARRRQARGTDHFAGRPATSARAGPRLPASVAREAAEQAHDDIVDGACLAGVSVLWSRIFGDWLDGGRRQERAPAVATAARSRSRRGDRGAAPRHEDIGVELHRVLRDLLSTHSLTQVPRAAARCAAGLLLELPARATRRCAPAASPRSRPTMTPRAARRAGWGISSRSSSPRACRRRGRSRGRRSSTRSRRSPREAPRAAPPPRRSSRLASDAAGRGKTPPG